MTATAPPEAPPSPLEATERLRFACLRVVEREARIYRHLWRGNFFSSFVQPVLYLGAMGVGLGGLVDANNRGMGDLTYLQYVAPGLMAATALQMAAGDSLWPIIAGMKWLRHFHAMAATPLAPRDVFLGVRLWLALRMVVSAVAFLVVATALGGVRSPTGVLAVPVAVLTGSAFGAPAAAFSATQEDDGRFPLVMRFVVLPLFLFSGTFFPVTQLPGWLQPVVWLSPLWHGVELCRAATTGAWGPWGPAGAAAHLAILLVVLAVGLLLGVRAFTARLAP